MKRYTFSLITAISLIIFMSFTATAAFTETILASNDFSATDGYGAALTHMPGGGRTGSAVSSNNVTNTAGPGDVPFGVVVGGTGGPQERIYFEAWVKFPGSVEPVEGESRQRINLRNPNGNNFAQMQVDSVYGLRITEGETFGEPVPAQIQSGVWYRIEAILDYSTPGRLFHSWSINREDGTVVAAINNAEITGRELERGLLGLDRASYFNNMVIDSHQIATRAPAAPAAQPEPPAPPAGAGAAQEAPPAAPAAQQQAPTAPQTFDPIVLIAVAALVSVVGIIAVRKRKNSGI